MRIKRQGGPGVDIDITGHLRVTQARHDRIGYLRNIRDLERARIDIHIACISAGSPERQIGRTGLGQTARAADDTRSSSRSVAETGSGAGIGAGS